MHFLQKSIVHESHRINLYQVTVYVRTGFQNKFDIVGRFLRNNDRNPCFSPLVPAFAVADRSDTLCRHESVAVLVDIRSVRRIIRLFGLA